MLTSIKQIVRATARLGTAALLMSAAVHAHSQEVTRGGSLNVLSITAINSLNPAIQSGVATGVPAAQLFASLLQADAKWQFHPYLADSWSVSPDGLSYTFRLNKDAKFHDGKPITSADVAFSAETVKANHPFGPAMLAALDKVETPDAHTAVFRLRQPNPALLLACSTPALMPILPKHVYGNGPIRQNPKNNAPVGSGPFRFVEYKPGEYLTLERFDGYFRKGKPYLHKITYSIVPDRAAAALAMQRGDIHFVAFAPFRIADVDRLAADPKLTVTRSGYEGVGSLNWLAFNTREGPLANVKVRQAISYAIDRDFISQKLQRGRSAAGVGPGPPGQPVLQQDAGPLQAGPGPRQQAAR
ncbi:ABC transporter substrate-binding protein [Cupriavidus basilensis]